MKTTGHLVVRVGSLLKLSSITLGRERGRGREGEREREREKGSEREGEREGEKEGEGKHLDFLILF